MCVPESLVPALLRNPPPSLAVAFLEVLGSSSTLLASIIPWLLGGEGAGRKNCLGVVIVDRMAFTWSTSSLDFWANSGPNREGDTPSKLECSSTKGSRALFICVITLVHLR